MDQSGDSAFSIFGRRHEYYDWHQFSRNHPDSFTHSEISQRVDLTDHNPHCCSGQIWPPGVAVQSHLWRSVALRLLLTVILVNHSASCVTGVIGFKRTFYLTGSDITTYLMQAEVHRARLLGECEKVAAKVIEHKLSEKLCNNCSSQAFTNDKNTRPPRHGLESSFSVCIHLSQGGWGERKYCILWLCLFYRETNVMHGKACKYESIYISLALPIWKTHICCYFARVSNVAVKSPSALHG